MSNKPVVSEQQQTRAHIEAEPNRDQIRERAYYRYVERGRADGKALGRTGSCAETEIRRQVNAQSNRRSPVARRRPRRVIGGLPGFTQAP